MCDYLTQKVYMDLLLLQYKVFVDVVYHMC